MTPTNFQSQLLTSIFCFGFEMHTGKNENLKESHFYQTFIVVFHMLFQLLPFQTKDRLSRALLFQYPRIFRKQITKHLKHEKIVHVCRFICRLEALISRENLHGDNVTTQTVSTPLLPVSLLLLLLAPSAPADPINVFNFLFSLAICSNLWIYSVSLSVFYLPSEAFFIWPWSWQCMWMHDIPFQS